MRTAENKRYLDPTIRWLDTQLCRAWEAPTLEQPIEQLYDLTRIQQASFVAACGELVMRNGAHVFGPYLLRHGYINSPNTPPPDRK
jgi:hypothetical protein